MSNEPGQNWRELLADANGRHLDLLAERSWQPFPYDFVKKAEDTKWRIPFVGYMVAGDLQEGINLLNAWGSSLRDWHTWLEVLSEYDFYDAWTIRSHYVDPIAFFCTFQPSATKDRFISIATDGIHQGNLSADSHYPDRLSQDSNPRITRNRREAAQQLRQIGRRWSSFADFDESLRRLNASSFIHETRNFRNLASHAIAPRFDFGMTKIVTRSIGPRSELVEQSDGAVLLVDHPTETAVSYSLGGYEPLEMKKICQSTHREYEVARKALSQYQDLLQEIIHVIDN